MLLLNGQATKTIFIVFSYKIQDNFKRFPFEYIIHPLK